MSSLGPALAAANAACNLLSAFFIIAGLRHIGRGHRQAHMRAMLAAAAFSALFLVGYLIRYGLYGSTPFAGMGWVRPVYYTLLATHIVLAMVEVPLILAALYRALQGYRTGEWVRHRRVARFAYPVWLYVSVTGVGVYLLLYQVYA